MTRAARASEWMLKRSRVMVAATVGVTIALAVPMVTMAPDTTASQMPAGEVVEAQDLIAERFVSDLYVAAFIVEARDGNALSRASLLELYENTTVLRANTDINSKLFSYFSPDFNAEVAGIYTIADGVDARLRSAGLGGLAGASDRQVDETVTSILSASAPSSWGLLSAATFDPTTGLWSAPALIVNLVARNEALGGGGQAVTLGSDDTVKEEFARDAQAALRGDERSIQVWGVAIDLNLTVGEQAAAAGPFIGFTILAVLVVAGLILRSYWAVAVMGAGLGALIIWLKGISNLIGLENDQVLSFIVPIAMISFGVDFAFHAFGRYREETASGYRPRAAFVVGMGGVLAALVLALASDSVAFLSNVSSGIESITQFGVAAAIALVAAFFVLGIVTPLILMHIDERVGAAQPRGFRRVGREMGSGLAATGAMAVVLFLVYFVPAVGVIMWAAYALAFIAGPYAVARRRKPAEAVTVPSAQIRGKAIGRAAAAVARRRGLVLPLVLISFVVAIAVAIRIEPRFDVKDFFAVDSDFVVGLDKLDEHVGQLGGEGAEVYVEADLTNPETLRILGGFADGVRALRIEQLAIDDAGVTQLGDGVLGVIGDVMGSPFAIGAIDASGTALTDVDGYGFPDSGDQVAALFAFASRAGVPLDAERLIRTPQSVALDLWQAEGSTTQATHLTVGVVGSGSQENVAMARDALAPLVDDLQDQLRVIDGDARAVLTGSAMTRLAQLDAITRALFVALPISVILCFILGALFMRSARLGAVSVVPILVVVAWLYAFMHLAGYGINVVTATIGAVSIGIGIDFAIHFIMRYREEQERIPDRLGAVEAAGTGTGAALAASGLSSIVGFAIMALAPMPMFATYGFLTAIMIVMALAATLLVLPGLLIIATSDAPEPVLAEVARATE